MKWIIVFCLVGLVMFLPLAWAEENPLAPYAINGFGMCGLHTTDGQKLYAPCAVMTKEGEDETYFAIFSDDGEELLLIIKRTDEGGQIIWQKPEKG